MLTMLGNGSATTANAGVADGVVLAKNNARKYARITNLSDAVVYLNLGAVAEVGKGLALAPLSGGAPVPAGVFETGVAGLLFTGDIHAIAGGATKALAIVEA